MAGIAGKIRKQIEKRLLKGRSRWENEEERDFKQRRSSVILSRIHWLYQQGCKFTFDLNEETEKLKIDVPDWKEEYAKSATDSLETKSGWVKPDKSYSVLLKEPLGLILGKAQELTGRAKDFTESDPFAGLCEEKPVRAFVALIHAAKRGEYPEWAWRKFFNARRDKADDPKFLGLIAARVV